MDHKSVRKPTPQRPSAAGLIPLARVSGADGDLTADYAGMAQGKAGQWLPDFDDAFDLVDEE